MGKKWWRAHNRTRKVYDLLVRQPHRDHLVAHVQVGGAKTTTRIEGGINAMIKQTLQLHRGRSVERHKQTAEWALVKYPAASARFCR